MDDFAQRKEKCLDTLTAITVLSTVDLDLTMVEWVDAVGTFVVGIEKSCVRHMVQRRFSARIPLAVERMPRMAVEALSEQLTRGNLVITRVWQCGSEAECKFCKAHELPLLGQKLGDL